MGKRENENKERFDIIDKQHKDEMNRVEKLHEK